MAMTSDELLTIIDRLAADESLHCDIYGWVRTINVEDLQDACGTDFNFFVLQELENARIVRMWGGGYVLYVDRIYDPLPS